MGRSVELHVLGKPLADAEALADQWPVIRSELRALENLDVPYFFAAAGETDLSDASGPLLRGCLAAPPLDRAVALLAKLSDLDCEQQVARIRSSLRFPVVRVEAAAPPHRRVVSDDEKAAWAVSLGQMLLRDAVQHPDGALSWWKRMDAGKIRSGTIDAGLYEGTSGLAFFLAALHKYTSIHEFRTAAERAIAPVLKSARGSGSAALAEGTADFGLGTGLGSACYALTRLAAFLSDSSYLDHALDLVRAVEPRAICGDVALDLMGGSAGAIVGLITLHEATSDPLPLELAELFARVSSRRWPGPRRAWVTNARKPQVGFAHGASGIVHALHRLYIHRPDTSYRLAIREALSYERDLFDADRGNWPVFIGADDQGFQTSWCYGAPGIALARLSLLATLPDEDLRDDLKLAVHATVSAPPCDTFHLCCGNLGALPSCPRPPTVSLTRVAQEARGRLAPGDALSDPRRRWDPVVSQPPPALL